MSAVAQKPAASTPTALPASQPSERLLSLDAYRGFVMLAMASDGLRLSEVAEHFPDSRLWQWLGYQSSHVPWVGCAFWDLIQPSFMFMVGVAMPYSLAARRARGQSELRAAVHAVYRAVVLVALGVFLYSGGHRQTNWTFVNVLAQIGLGYLPLYFLSLTKPAVQIAAAVLILVGYWGWFWQTPLPDAAKAAAYADADAPAMPGLYAHWDKHTNAAAEFDRWFLNELPRDEPFRVNGGGYQTLNFVPSLATMIFGLLAGQWMRTARSGGQKFFGLIVAGAAMLAVGWLWGATLCPLVKRIWTPSWAVFSTGWTLWMLAAFYVMFDLSGWRRAARPLAIVGANSIAIYMLAELLSGWWVGTLRTHLGQDLFGGTYGPIAMSVVIVATLWLIAWRMDRARLYIRI